MPKTRKLPDLAINAVEYECSCGRGVTLQQEDDEPIEKLVRCWDCLSKEGFF